MYLALMHRKECKKNEKKAVLLTQLIQNVVIYKLFYILSAFGMKRVSATALFYIFLVAEFFANQKNMNPVWNAGVTCIDKL